MSRNAVHNTATPCHEMRSANTATSAVGHTTHRTVTSACVAPLRFTSDRAATSAPGTSTSRAGSTFVRATQANAHNPLLLRTDSFDQGEFAGPLDCVPNLR